MQNYHNIGLLITITPLKQNDDFVITKELLQEKLELKKYKTQSLIIRTLPNEVTKKTRNCSNTNPPYFTNEVMEFIVQLGVEHLLIDLPSVDKENDEGKLAAHHIFWNYPTLPRFAATITEMIYVPNEVEDGLYFVNIQIMPIELDASSSNIVLYELTEKK